MNEGRVTHVSIKEDRGLCMVRIEDEAGNGKRKALRVQPSQRLPEVGDYIHFVHNQAHLKPADGSGNRLFGAVEIHIDLGIVA